MLSLIARTSRLSTHLLLRKPIIKQYEYLAVRSFYKSNIFRTEKTTNSEESTVIEDNWATRLIRDGDKRALKEAEEESQAESLIEISHILPKYKTLADSSSLDSITLNETYAKRGLLTFRVLEHKVIPDIVDELKVNPAIDFIVQYPGIFVEGGNILTPSQVQVAPNVTIDNPNSNHYYTLLLVDPDAPSNANPTMREYLHWFVANIPGSAPITTNGEAIVEYIGSLPPEKTGKHRYVFLLFEHNGKITFSEQKIGKNLNGRAKFKTRDFIRKYKLDNPISISFFLAENDASVAKIMKSLP